MLFTYAEYLYCFDFCSYKSLTTSDDRISKKLTVTN